MIPDAKWLDLLKASGWQFAMLALMSIAALIGDKLGWLPFPLDATFQQGTMLAALAFIGLWLSSIGQAASKGLSGTVATLRRKWALRAHARKFRDYIPFMTKSERAIIAQLLHENRKTFTNDIDGGKAATLIAQGYIAVGARRGQNVAFDDVPFFVPEHIWEVAAARRADFPYCPDPDGADAWRVHWMAR